MGFEDDCWKDFISHIHDRYGAIWQSADLFGEALRCFSSGAYFATCVMCRGSVEALLHLAMTRQGPYTRLDPDTSWRNLETWASNRGLLKGIKRKVERVRNSGNFAAHLAQKIDDGYTKITSRRTRGVLLRLDKETALNRILETSEIIIKVTERRWP